MVFDYHRITQDHALIVEKQEHQLRFMALEVAELLLKSKSLKTQLMLQAQVSLPHITYLFQIGGHKR